MDELSRFERRLTAGLDAYAGPRRPVEGLAVALAAIARADEQAPGLKRLFRALRLDRRWASPMTAPIAVIALVAAALLLVVFVAAGIGLVRLAPIVPPPSPEGTERPSTLATQTTAPTRPSWTRISDLPDIVGPGAFAMLLRDGGVLVLGNGAGDLYDPRAGQWNAIDRPLTGIGSATLLGDGSVLVAGGGRSGAGAERYDMTTRKWIATGSLLVGRTGSLSGDPFTATRLPDGTVLVAGGANLIRHGIATHTESAAELYDPLTGRWVRTGSMIHARAGHAAALLSDGRVLVAGGFVRGGTGDAKPVESAELFDPSNGTWSSVESPSMEVGSLTLLTDGTVLAIGSSPAGGAVQLFDPRTARWDTTGSLLEADNVGGTVTLLHDGRVLVAGGGSPADATAELYDPATGTWTATTSMLEPRDQHAAVLLADGMVLVCGGEKAPLSANWLASCEVYDPGSER